MYMIASDFSRLFINLKRFYFHWASVFSIPKHCFAPFLRFYSKLNKLLFVSKELKLDVIAIAWRQGSMYAYSNAALRKTFMSFD